MSEIENQLQKLESLKSTNLGNLGLVGSDMAPTHDPNNPYPDPTGSTTNEIRLSGVVKDAQTGELSFIDYDGTETKIATVESTTGFSRFVFDVAGQFSLVADSAKDSITMLGQGGIKLETDPTIDAMIISADPGTLIPTVGSGNSLLNASGSMRSLVAGDNLSVVTTEEEIQLGVNLALIPVGTGINPYHGLSATGQAQIRSILDSDTVKLSLSADSLSMSLEAIPNVAQWGSSGIALVQLDPDNVAQIRNISSGNNIRLSTAIDGEVIIESLQAFANTGSGIALVSQGASDILDVKTLSGGGGVTINDDGSGTLEIISETQIDNVGTGAPLSYVDQGIGKMRSLKAGFGVQVNQTASEVELQADVRSQNLGDGAAIGNVTTGGLLELKTIKAADGTITVNDPGDGTLTLQAQLTGDVVNARLDDALDGSGEPYHLILNTDGGLEIDAGAIPYLRATYDSTTEKILVYERNALIGQIPDSNPAYGWPNTLDFNDPPDTIEFIDLND